MPEHPIQGLMTTAMQSIKDMVDVNTIVGDAVQSPDGTVIIPISRVCFGFAAGGGEYSPLCCTDEGKEEDDEEDSKGGGEEKKYKFPFAGGSGAGVSISPVAFMVVGNGQIRLLPININSSVDKILDLIPELIEKANETFKRRIVVKKDIKTGTSHDSEKISKKDKIEFGEDE